MNDDQSSTDPKVQMALAISKMRIQTLLGIGIIGIVICVLWFAANLGKTVLEDHRYLKQMSELMQQQNQLLKEAHDLNVKFVQIMEEYRSRDETMIRAVSSISTSIDNAAERIGD